MTKFQKLLMMFRPISEMVYLAKVEGQMQGFNDGVRFEQARQNPKEFMRKNRAKSDVKLHIVRH